MDYLSPRLATSAIDIFETKVLTLASWPQLRQVPADRLGCYARICVLLAYAPSVGFLIHRRLGLESEEVLPVLHALHDAGHLRVTCDAHQPGNTTILEEEAPSVEPEIARRTTLWGKLLTKLLS
ncbi:MULTISPECIES: hypothetical protein [unclassified Variovorax]|uniref:hypothetical protein n=1 Tax=unclassified Variovorax TaxID=663243 RepID=UPI003F4875C8